MCPNGDLFEGHLVDSNIKVRCSFAFFSLANATLTGQGFHCSHIAEYIALLHTNVIHPDPCKNPKPCPPLKGVLNSGMGPISDGLNAILINVS